LKKIILTLPGAQLSLCSISLAVASSKTNGYTDSGAFRVRVNRGCHPCLSRCKKSLKQVQKIRFSIILNVKFYILPANVYILTENDKFENSSKSLSWEGGRVAI
jgi:hypothetical protein